MGLGLKQLMCVFCLFREEQKHSWSQWEPGCSGEEQPGRICPEDASATKRQPAAESRSCWEGQRGRQQQLAEALGHCVLVCDSVHELCLPTASVVCCNPANMTCNTQNQAPASYFQSYLGQQALLGSPAGIWDKERDSME